ncbi:MAG: NRDE family protein [Desulfobacteraceae bacterium]|nr:NRDE family protein [Desulfobacteraceae bacterium]
MCLILFGYKVSEKYPLVLVANRDEFYQRPTAPMHFWEDRPSILAGKDLEQGGTWFGVSKNGRFAALTNYRDPSSIKQHAPSRGEIIVDYLQSNKPEKEYFKSFRQKAKTYNGFNLIFGNMENLYWFSNLKNSFEKIKPGIHGISNHFLDTPWPKVASGKKALEKIINEKISSQDLFPILTDQSMPDESLLPDTGVGIELEKMLSPLFIQSDIYGTRSSTVMIADRQGNLDVSERTYSPENKNDYTNQSFILKNDFA